MWWIKMNIGNQMWPIKESHLSLSDLEVTSVTLNRLKLHTSKNVAHMSSKLE